MKLYNADCLTQLRQLEAESVDLTVTSPPYDSLRSYEALPFDKFTIVANELFRITKEGGVVVWVVGDASVKGSETGTSFRQALYFKDVGFKLHDTMIYMKNNVVPLTHCRYEQAFEYMFVFTKGKPRTFNPIEDKPNKHAGEIFHGTQYSGNKTKKMTFSGVKTIRQFGRRTNVFIYNNPGRRGLGHPAAFPEALAKDHIISWSNEGDTVLDPFMGSGTTGKMAKTLNRKFIGIEKEPEYFEIAQKRIG